MEVVRAEHAGFCFGVERVVSEVERRLAGGKKLYTYGPVIHNERVVDDLRARGAEVIDNIDGLDRIDGETLVIRAHGVTVQVMERIRELGIDYCDRTCPFVARIHRLVAEATERGEFVVVAGDSSHPEVEGIVSCCGEGGLYAVVRNAEEARALEPPAGLGLCIVAQTTFQAKIFQEIVEIFEGRGYNANVVNTICSATGERQTEAARLAGEMDAMVVIGSATSSNSRKLAEICEERCPRTYFVSGAGELPESFPEGVERIGITAGASTPNNTIEEVQDDTHRGGR